MYLRAMWLMTCLALTGSAAMGLEPAEIVVVVNANQPKSQALGRFYCAKRGVPAENLVAMDLPTTDTIAQADYETKLRLPLRETLAQRGLTDKVRCLLTVWGVPFRLTAGENPPDIKRMLAWYAEAAGRARRRVARNLLLLGQVGSHFPPTATPTTEPEKFDLLFQLTPQTPKELPPMHGLKRRFSAEVRRKAAALGEIADADHRAIAARQIVALFLDTFGMTGWPTAVELVGSDGPAVPGSLRRDKAEAEATRAKLMKVKSPDAQACKKLEQAIAANVGMVGLYAECVQGTVNIQHRPNDSRASVDNELALLLAGEYSREAWGANPLNWTYYLRRKKLEAGYGGRTLMVSRIDGPTIDSVMRLVLNAIEVEKTGLTGKAYVDLGARKPKKFDEELLNAARMLTAGTKIPVLADGEPPVFPAGSCPEAALYVGWRSPNRYVPAFTWRPGAVGYHVTMAEGRELRDARSQQWAPQMIQAGVAVTVAAADDPGIQAFPAPSAFFPLLVSGRFTVCEVYWRTLPHVSWRMMLIADPLYNPFRKNPQPMELPKAVFAPWD